jgi:hypothetical protein
MPPGAADPPRALMRIALVHPTYWPEVTRGSERFIHDLGSYLSRRGHEVTVLTAHRGRPTRSREDGMTVIRGRRPPARLHPKGAEPHAAHAPLAFLGTLRGRFDASWGLLAHDRERR